MSPAPRTLFEKIWSRHVVTEGDGDMSLLYVDRLLMHDGAVHTFDRLRKTGRAIRRPEAIAATADHYVPTAGGRAAIADAEVRGMVEAMGRHTAELGIPYFPPGDARQGIVHVMGPEQGFTLPGITLVCGDSHTATHGAFGCLAFGIGSSELEHVLATSCLWQTKPHAMRIRVEGALPARRRRQGRDPRHHRPHQRGRRHRARDRVRGPGHRRDVDGRADDGVQHVHRGGRPCGHGGA